MLLEVPVRKQNAAAAAFTLLELRRLAKAIESTAIMVPLFLEAPLVKASTLNGEAALVHPKTLRPLAKHQLHLAVDGNLVLRISVRTRTLAFAVEGCRSAERQALESLRRQIWAVRRAAVHNAHGF